MDTPSKDTRLAIWKVTLARSSFIQARRACEALLQLGARSRDLRSSKRGVLAKPCYSLEHAREIFVHPSEACLRSPATAWSTLARSSFIQARRACEALLQLGARSRDLRSSKR